MGFLGLPFGSQNRSKNRSRSPLEHREAPGACPGASGPSKVTKNGAQSEPKTLKIDPLDASRLPKRSPRRHEISKNGALTRESTFSAIIYSILVPGHCDGVNWPCVTLLAKWVQAIAAFPSVLLVSASEPFLHGNRTEQRDVLLGVAIHTIIRL